MQKIYMFCEKSILGGDKKNKISHFPVVFSTNVILGAKKK